jgi:hypothetical protein
MVVIKLNIFQAYFHVIYINFQQKAKFNAKLNKLGNKTHLMVTK